MNKIFITLLFVIGQLTTFAQSQPKSLSLKEAIAIAMNSRADLQADGYNTLIAQNNIDRKKRIWIPDVSANANLRYNIGLQGTLIPAGFGGLPEPAILSLGARNVTAFGLDISEPLYRPTLKTELRLAEVSLQATKESKSVAENALKAKIAEAYYNVSLKKLQRTMLMDVEKRYKEYLLITEGKFKNGVALESEYLKTKLDADNAAIEVTKAEQAYAFSLTYLKYLINMPTETEVIVTDTLRTKDTAYNGETLPTTINRPEVRILDLQNKSLDLMTQRTKESFLPTVSLYANASIQYLNNNYDYTKDFWNPYSFVGVRMEVPLSAKYKSVETLNEYALKLKQGTLEQEQKNADIHFEIEKAKTDIQNALLNLKSTKMSYDLSNDLYAQQVKQFALGGLLYSNILDTERTLNTSEQNYVRAIYDYIIAKISWQKATGQFE